MADATFDVVIIGGGAKALVTAIYLAKYGGMTVGIFERRHELGGGLASTEAAAPGFIGDVHTSQMTDYYYLPVQQDFPDFEEKGGKLMYSKGTSGIITREHQECLTRYSLEYDPTQEKTVREITRFAGEKDTDTFWKLWEYDQKSEQSYFDASVETLFNLPPAPGEESSLRRWIANFLKQPDCPIDQDWLFLSAYRAVSQLFESPGLSFMFLRDMETSGQPILEPGGASFLIGQVLLKPRCCFVQGGTHNIAHAYIKILLANGGKFFTRSHVDKIIIENGTAKGIRLSDGTQVEARKFVLSGVNLQQLCFQLIGREHFSQRLLKKVEGIEATHGTITWYTWAVREPTIFRAAEHNPDINETRSVVLGCQDLEVLYRSVYLRRLGMIPPIESTILHQMFCGDKYRQPEGRQTILTEQYVAPANLLSERDWLQFKTKHAEEVVREWQVFTTNLTWDNIIGYDPITPYDTAGQLINMSPTGDYFMINVEPARPLGTFLPSEFARYNVPNINNLYATGGQWGPFGGSCLEGYRAYKVIAEDLGLTKPWEEKGRPY